MLIRGRGLIVKSEVYHGGLFEGGLNRAWVLNRGFTVCDNYLFSKISNPQDIDLKFAGSMTEKYREVAMSKSYISKYHVF